MIFSESRTFTSNLNSPLTKYLTDGYPFTPNCEAIAPSLVASKAANTPDIYKNIILRLSILFTDTITFCSFIISAAFSYSGFIRLQ